MPDIDAQQDRKETQQARKEVALRTLKRLLAELHTNRCDSEHCDINKAYDEGCVLWAAHLFYGATETPAAFDEAFQLFNPEELEEDRRYFLASVGWAYCVKCGASIYGESGEHTCSNCLYTHRYVTRILVRTPKWRWKKGTSS